MQVDTGVLGRPVTGEEHGVHLWPGSPWPLGTCMMSCPPASLSCLQSACVPLCGRQTQLPLKCLPSPRTGPCPQGWTAGKESSDVTHSVTCRSQSDHPMLPPTRDPHHFFLLYICISQDLRLLAPCPGVVGCGVDARELGAAAGEHVRKEGLRAGPTPPSACQAVKTCELVWSGKAGNHVLSFGTEQKASLRWRTGGARTRGPSRARDHVNLSLLLVPHGPQEHGRGGREPWRSPTVQGPPASDGFGPLRAGLKHSPKTSQFT